MAARHQLDGHVGDDVPGLAQLSDHARAVCPAVNLEEAAVGLENAFFCLVPALGCECRLNAEHRGQPGMIFAGDAGVCRCRQPADRRRREGDGLGQAGRVELQQPPGGDCAAKDRDKAAVESARPEGGRDRLADATRRLIAENDCRQHIFAAGTGAFRHSECRGDQGRAGMHDVSQVAVVGRSRIAHHGIDLGRLGYG